MVRTIFGKVLLIIILVLIISFIITGLLMNAGLQRMTTEQKASQLEEASKRVISVLDTLIKTSTIKDTFVFTSFLMNLEENNNAIIWVVRNDGAIIFFSSIPDFVTNKLKISQDGWPLLPDERQYSDSLEKFTTGDFFGLFKDTGMKWLTLSERFEIKGALPNNIVVQGQILIHTPIPGIQQLKSSILVIFLISFAIGAVIALIFVVFLSKKTLRPLKLIKNSARRVAAGEFTERIPVKGKDEIAELTNSFNNMVLALQNLEQMRRDFISNVSHELRTPLTSIKGFIQAILDGVIDSERYNEYLVIVRDEVNRMQKLVNELLDLAKMQSGKIDLNYMVFDINELIRRCVITFQQGFLEKNLDFRADFETEKMFVYADKSAIQRVILNLLNNAIKFTGKGGQVNIKTYTEKEKTFIVVEDTGKGIPEDEIPYIFERFYKTDKARSADKSGVGLGLAIVRSIIISHNQDIKVESKEGHGTRFIFTLRSAPRAETY